MVKMESKKININISDFQKVFAVTAVILQTILTFALANTTNTKTAAFIGAFYIIVKYTAPLFIFSIVFNMVKTSKSISYLEFLKEKFFELVVPYILWTTAYLFIFPAVQQGKPYTGIGSFLLEYVTGNGAPHLWYTVMMFQIQLLMPFFVWLGYKVFSNKKNVWPVLIGATVIYVAWYVFYDMQVLNGALHDNWYLLDRFVLSFMLYGVFGTATFIYEKEVFNFVNKIRFALLPIGLVIAMFSIQNLLSHSGDLTFANAPYLNTVQSLYSLVVIFAVFEFASRMIKANSNKLAIFKWLSTYAYRTYLANVFVFQVVLVLFKDTLLRMPSFVMILLAYLTTVTCAFLLSYVLHIIWSSIKKVFVK